MEKAVTRFAGTVVRKPLTAPVSVDVSITGSCNLRCKYCYAESDHAVTAHLPRERLKQLFIELDTLGVHFVRVAGGEPLTHPDIFLILEDLRAFSFNYSISTNGTLLTANNVARIRDLEVPWIVLSIDGPTAEINNRTRGAFSAVARGLDRALKAGLPVSASVVITASNVAYISETVYFLQSRGLHKIALLIYCPVGRAIQYDTELALTKSDYDGFINSVLQLRVANPSLKLDIIAPHESAIPWEVLLALPDTDSPSALLERLGYDPAALTRDKILGCQAGITTCAIAPNGGVYGCEQFMCFQEMQAGNIFDSALIQIWKHSPVFRSLRSISYRSLTGHCSSCSIPGCGGGCRAVAYGIEGDLTKSDNRCQAYKHVSK